MVESLSRLVVIAPDWRVERLGHTEAHAHRDAHNEDYYQDLGDDPVPLAQPGQGCVAAALHLCALGLLLPVVLAGPNLVIGLACTDVWPGCARLLLRVDDLHGLDVGLKRVEGVAGV